MVLFIVLNQATAWLIKHMLFGKIDLLFRAALKENLTMYVEVKEGTKEGNSTEVAPAAPDKGGS